jgi:hypothetical protein
VGLSGELAKEWSRVHPKPDSVNGQMTLLREIGHAIEDHNKLEANRRGRKDRTEHQDRQPNRRSKKNRKSKTPRVRLKATTKGDDSFMLLIMVF